MRHPIGPGLREMTVTEMNVIDPRRTRGLAPALVLAVVLALGVAACGGVSDRAASPTTEPTTTEVLAPEDTDTEPGANGGGGGGRREFVPPTTTAPVDLAPDLLERLPDLDLAGVDAAFDPRTCEVEITMTSETVGFAFDSDVIPPDGPGHAALVAVAELLAGADEVTVVGHSSSEGDPTYNVELSQRRAEAARAVLAPRMPGTRFVVRGVGSAEPRQPEDGTEASRAPNRRVVIAGEVTSDELCPPGTTEG